jgi:NAD(P)H-hydrate epimerase
MKFSLESAKRLLPIRKKKENKTHGGRTLIIAGQKGFFGAAILAATASARVGSGYTTLMTALDHFPTHKHPDFLTIPLSQTISANFDAIAIGPGLGINSKTEKLLRSLIRQNFENVVIDADAITILSQFKIVSLPKSWILTPHAGELARLLGVSSKLIEKNRMKYALMAQKKFGCHILLKGHKTIILNSDVCIEITSGNSGLAKSGTGDVLTGMIAGFLSQNLNTIQAASLASYIHGSCSKKWVKQKRDSLSLLASDLLNLIPEVIFDLRNKKSQPV